MKDFSIFFCTFFGLGYLTKFPGTLCSFVTLFLIWLIKFKFSMEIVLSIYILSFVISFFLISKVINILKEKDPSIIVVDEYIGQFTALLFCQENIVQYFFAFILFRFFDILKPFPIGWIDSRNGSFYVLFDDILAGLYAGLILQITYFFWVNG